MNDDLKFIFTNVNDWLKFAEAKNTGLLALNLAAIIGILQISHFEEYKQLQGVFVIFFAFSSLLNLITLSPVVNYFFRSFKRMDDNLYNKSKDNFNVLFFGHIAKLSSNQFIDLFQYKTGTTLQKSIDKELASQIANNADLCESKFAIFRVAAWISFGTFVLGICLAFAKFIL